MHEWSLAEEIRLLISQHALQNKLQRISKISLEIGALSCVEPEALYWALNQLLSAPVDIVMSTPSGRVVCRHCNHEYETVEMHCTCPRCKKYGFTIKGGDQMRITSFEGV
jgi:hydrogenase nickel incorporation protein HypA/HybF